MVYQTLAFNRRPPLAIITLSRQGSGNRIDRALLSELRTAIDQAEEDAGLRTVIITGAGSAFSMGWDPVLLGELEQEGVQAGEPDLLGSTFQFLVESSLPVIAAINGDALSAGLELALACDFRLAVESANLGLPDIIDGRIPMAGGTQRLARIAGHPRATELILTGRIISAGQALSWGILNAVCGPGELLSAATRIAETVATRGPIAVRLAKEAVYRGVDMPLQQALRYETDLTVLLQTTSDRAEGVRAFVEKREPHFEGN